MARTITTGGEEEGEEQGEGSGGGRGTTMTGSPPHVDLSWSVHSTEDRRESPLRQMQGLRFKVNPLLPGQGGRAEDVSPDQSILSLESVDPVPLTVKDLAPRRHPSHPPHPSSPPHSSGGGGGGRASEERYSVGSLLPLGCSHALPSREEPDGQSDISPTTPDFASGPPPVVVAGGNSGGIQLCSDPPSHALTPPPSTPLIANGNNKPLVTPAMIHSALDALQRVRNKDTPICLTPSDETPAPIFPEAVTSALAAWISRQSYSAGHTPLVSPPPSTPLEEGVAANDRSAHVISAADLIAALTAALEAREEREGSGEGESPVACTVPQGTPQEGLVSEWARLGIRPEEVIQALSALTIPSVEEEVAAKEGGEGRGGGGGGGGEGFAGSSPYVLSPISEELLSAPLPPCVLSCGDMHVEMVGRRVEGVGEKKEEEEKEMEVTQEIDKAVEESRVPLHETRERGETELSPNRDPMKGNLFDELEAVFAVSPEPDDGVDEPDEGTKQRGEPEQCGQQPGLVGEPELDIEQDSGHSEPAHQQSPKRGNSESKLERGGPGPCGPEDMAEQQSGLPSNAGDCWPVAGRESGEISDPNVCFATPEVDAPNKDIDEIVSEKYFTGESAVGVAGMLEQQPSPSDNTLA